MSLATLQTEREIKQRKHNKVYKSLGNTWLNEYFRYKQTLR